MLIIFDLDDTLVLTTESIIPGKLSKGVEQASPSLNEHLEHLLRMDQMSDSSSSSLAEFSEIHSQNVDEVMRHVKEGNLDDIYVEAIEQVNECLASLSYDHHLCLVSRGEEKRQLEKLKRAEIDTTHFSDMIFCKEKKAKAYLTLSQKYADDPHDVLVCGDRVSLDLTPAKQLGFHTVHMLQGRGKKSFDYFSDVDVKIIQLVELFDIIDTIKRKNFLRKL